MRPKIRILAEFSQCLLVFNLRVLSPFGVPQRVSKAQMRNSVLWIFLVIS